MEVYKWSTTAAENNAASPDGAPEGWTGAQVNNSVREMMAALRAAYADSAYVELTYRLPSVGAKSLARISATRIDILLCDATAHFTANRRLKIVGATTGYGRVVSSTFSTDTQVTVEMEAGDVPTSPTAIYVHVDPTIRELAFKRPGSGNGADADTVDTYHASDLLNNAFKNALVNGGPIVWQRGTASTSCPAATRTYLADQWYTNPANAAVTAERTATRPTGSRTPYALKVTGATSVNECIVAGQRLESIVIPGIKTTVTISALVKNETTASLTLSLLLGTPGAVDDFTSVTNRLTQALTAIASGASARVSHSVDISGYTNLDNGLQVEFQAPAGALDSVSKSITICEMQVEVSSAFTSFGQVPLPLEEERCYRYYYLSGAKAETAANGLTHVFTVAELLSADTAVGTNRWPVRMRATPTVSVWGNGVSGTVYLLTDGTTETGWSADVVTDRACRRLTKNGTALAVGECIGCNLEASAVL